MKEGLTGKNQTSEELFNYTAIINKRVWKAWSWWINGPFTWTNLIKRFTNPLSDFIKHISIYTRQSILKIQFFKQQETSNLASSALYSIGLMKLSNTRWSEIKLGEEKPWSWIQFLTTHSRKLPFSSHHWYFHCLMILWGKNQVFSSGVFQEILQ